MCPPMRANVPTAGGQVLPDSTRCMREIRTFMDSVRRAHSSGTVRRLTIH